jgi:hypothetical protein
MKTAWVPDVPFPGAPRSAAFAPYLLAGQSVRKPARELPEAPGGRLTGLPVSPGNFESV